ncbi:MAG: PepSY domain-containing protein [Alphaproteobacteria bacterium]|nr:PepSY domain-containing protein [Alphaproteobacteria bacterium]
MRKTLMIMAFVLAMPAGTALAEEGCFVPMSEWQPREAVVKLAKDKGWTVRRIKIDDGCYEIDARDISGKSFEATIHPETLEVLKIEQEKPEKTEEED